MNPPTFVLVTLLVTLVATILRGRTWAFAYLWVPYTLLVPWNHFLSVQGLPELTPHRAVVTGMLIGCCLSGKARELVPDWRKLDLWILVIILSFSTSFGLSTDVKGFFHKLMTQSLDWGLPYLFARTVFRDVTGLRKVIAPLAICAAVLGFCSLYEARMSARLLSSIWNAITGYEIANFWLNGGGYRWGLLRAFGPFGNPLILATVLVAITPLALSWGWLDRRRKTWSRVAALVVAVGIIGPISRGPLIVLGAITTIFGMVVARLPALTLTLFGGLLGYAVFSETVEDIVATTESDLSTEGNTESGKYRVALLMIYVEEIPKVGFFGDEKVVGARYEGAWSIDNSFLFMYITGGWVGGTLFLLLVIATCIKGYRALIKSSGNELKVRACVTASFVGMSACIANVWFTPEFAGLFFALVALVWNQSSPVWYGGSPREKRPMRARTKGRVRVATAAVPSLTPVPWPRPMVTLGMSGSNRR